MNPKLQRAFCQAIADHGLSLSSYNLLLSLHDGPQTMTNAAVDARCTTANLTGLADNLAKRGLVTRSHSTTDRRSVLLSITQAGADLIHSMGNLQRPVAA